MSTAKAVAVNGAGHYTVVMYTNPDLEDASRKMTLALDPYRSRSDFTLLRVVDLRGDVPPEMRGIVRVQIRKEQAKEDMRLKKAGVVAAAITRRSFPISAARRSTRSAGTASTTRSTSSSTIARATRSSGSTT